jgi:uncharacterized protein YbbK (DUF523 family)
MVDKLYLVSSCLVGLCCRYDCALKPNRQCLEFIGDNYWIPVCPEQLGGLPTPRSPADIINGDGYDVLNQQAKVINQQNQDVTDQFVQGAQQFLLIASSQPIDAVILKAKSPSCAVSGTIGVTAALLKQHDFPLIEF